MVAVSVLVKQTGDFVEDVRVDDKLRSNLGMPPYIVHLWANFLLSCC